MSLKLALTGSLKESIEQTIKTMEAAHHKALARTGGRIRRDLIKNARQAGLKTLSRAWRYKMYPEGKTKSLVPAIFVYPRGKRDGRTQKALEAHENGSVIRPSQGRYLAIPTGFNKPQGRRKSKDEPLVTPDKMISMRKWTYTIPTKDGRGLLWMLRVAEDEEEYKKHGPKSGAKRFAYAGGDILIGSGRRRRVDKILERGAVPMFLLLPQARLTKRTSATEIVKTHARALPSLVASEMAQRLKT